MANPGLASELSAYNLTDWGPGAPGEPRSVCPSWCTFESDHNAVTGHVAHRAALWELPDRVELCVMQVVSDHPADAAGPAAPMFYLWSADDAVFSDAECAEMAQAISRASEVLSRINGVSPRPHLAIPDTTRSS